MNTLNDLPNTEALDIEKLTQDIRNYFNIEFYSQITGVSEKKAINHYLTEGWRKGYDPSPEFSTMKYLKEHQDVRESNTNPLIHYLMFGIEEKRTIYPSASKLDYKPKRDDRRSLDKPVILSPELKGRFTQEQIDLINRKKLFSYSFYYKSYPDVYLSGQDGFLHYINHGWRENRNPSENFDTIFYTKEYPDVATCPFTHYVISGIAEKRLPYSRHTISYSASLAAIETPLDKKSKVAVHAHIFYPELGKEMIEACNNIPTDYALFITTTTQANADYLYNQAKLLSTASHIESIVVENRGRDIAPMLIGARSMWENYDYVCHIHSKKSLHTNFGNRWRAYTLDQLLGSAELIKFILNEFDSNPLAGVIFPDNFLEIKNFVSWGNNLIPAKRLFDKMRLPSYSLQDSWEFPAGSMCWIRTESLRPLLKLNLTLEDFETESGQVEGTLAHVIERSLIHISSSKGYEYIKYLAAPQNFRSITPAANIASPPQEKPVIHWKPQDTAISLSPRRPLAPLSQTFNPGHLNIHWIIPEYIEGLGGHTTIFRFVRYLELFGHHQTVWILNPHVHANEDEAKARIKEWFQPIGDNVNVRFLPKDVGGISGDVVISTDAWTVYPALAMPLFKERFYFVQDYEPSFYAKGTTYHLIENTYKFGLKALCAGSWLEGLMKKYNNWTKKWSLAYDSKFYFPSGAKPKHEGKIKIAFYSRISTPRRVVEIGLLALDLLNRQAGNFEVHLFGNDSPLNVEFPHINHGILKPAALGELYRACDIGMVFSATNYSLIPIEMMACDLPVIETDTESTRAVFNEQSVCFSQPDPVALAKTIKELINDQDRRTALIAGGREFIKDISWEGSARIVENGIIEALSEKYSPITVAELTRPCRNYNVKASVIVPTYNAGPEFESVLKMLVSQKTDWPYEVVVVDSGSTDETVSIIKKFNKVKLHTISNSEFQHGRTRNLAISLTNGEFIAVITQDALPVDRFWLKNLIAAFDKSNEIAGVFGRHLPYPDATEFVKNDINCHFDFYNSLPHVVSFKRGLPTFISKNSEQWQQFIHFFSDNNACLRRSVWEKIPYPEISWGEDQTWAWEILKHGFEKAYAHEAAVYHSHTLTYQQQLKVSIEEGNFFAKYFNYYPIKDRDNMHAALDERNLRDTQFAAQHALSTTLLDDRKNLNKASVSGILIGSQAQKFSSEGI